MFITFQTAAVARRRQRRDAEQLRWAEEPRVELLWLLINSSRKIGLLTKINFHSDRDYGGETD